MAPFASRIWYSTWQTSFPSALISVVPGRSLTWIAAPAVLIEYSHAGRPSLSPTALRMPGWYGTVQDRTPSSAYSSRFVPTDWPFRVSCTSGQLEKQDTVIVEFSGQFQCSCNCPNRARASPAGETAGDTASGDAQM